MASEKGLAYQLDWGDRTMSPPPPALPSARRPPLPPPPPSSALPPPPLLPLPARGAVKERLGSAGRQAGAERAGAVRASRRPPGRAACAAPRPRPRPRPAPRRAPGRAGTRNPSVAGPGGREGGDPACPGRPASRSPTRRPLPALGSGPASPRPLPPPGPRDPPADFPLLWPRGAASSPPSSGVSRLTR